MKKLILGFGLVSVVAIAAASSGPISIDALQKWFKAGIYLGPTATASSSNKITGAWSGCRSYDFPAIGGGATSVLPLCAESLGVTVTGAIPGDPCFVGVNLGADGGANLDVAVDLSCQFTAPGVGKVKACAHMSDAGSIDIPDAGYCLRDLSNF